MVRNASSPLRTSAPTRQRGVGLVEMLLALLVLAIAVLGYASLVLAQHGVGQSVQVEGQMLQVAREFMERMRADDWDGLYAKLALRYDEAQAYPDPNARLTDGRYATSPSAYYPSFVVPAGAASLRVLVAVPRDPPEGGGEGLVLREDVTHARFGLPADLDGDGVVDAMPKQTSYVVLPVEAIFVWSDHAGRAREFPLRTWLTGDR